MNYRRLTEDEILRLKSQSCLADDWGKVTVAESFQRSLCITPAFRVKCVWSIPIRVYFAGGIGNIPVCGM